MDLSELTAYASRKYQIQEQHKWSDFPGFSVLCHPRTGKWIALLMRQWDRERGEEIQRCDMKCGDSRLRFQRPYLSSPTRMRGSRWIGISFDDGTEKELVFQLLDEAVAAGNQHGCTIVLGSQAHGAGDRYQETAIPFSQSAAVPAKENIPERLREMRRLYEYGRESAESRARNFYRQAVFMRDYEDDVPWSGDFICYFPTYHDLSVRQLRGYFTWRAHLRRGEYLPIAASAAYLYVYELLNGVGADSPGDVLRKLEEFETGFLDSGVGDAGMRANLRRWMLEYAIIHELPPEQARQAADRELVGRDQALSVLKFPETCSDEEVFSALCRFGGKKTQNSPVLTADPERGKRLFSEAWRKAASDTIQGRDLFTLCFGERKRRQWYPLSNAVYYECSRPKTMDYVLDDCRSYHCRDGFWQMESYEKLSFDRSRFLGFLHETDARLRRYLKTGRYLRENAADEWAAVYPDAVIEEDRQALLEAARPKVTIDLSSLDRIRSDAVTTRDSLLTEEDREEEEISGEAVWPAPQGKLDGVPLDGVQIQILHALLDGRDASEIIREHHLMASIVADAVNEALFEEIGDTVLLCEGNALALVEDYTEDLERMLGGDRNG